MRLTVHHTVAELESWYRTESDADVASRVLMVLHARKGWSAEQIAEAVAKSRRTVQEWVRRYNAEGAAGLSDREGRGREPALSEEHAQRLRERLDAGPRDSDGVCTLRGLDVQRILEQEFGVLRALPSVLSLPKTPYLYAVCELRDSPPRLHERKIAGHRQPWETFPWASSRRFVF